MAATCLVSLRCTPKCSWVTLGCKARKYHSPLTTYHLPLTTYHLPLTTYHLPLTTYHLPLTTYHLPLTTYHLPDISAAAGESLDLPPLVQQGLV
jgi:hypothetical protein